MSSTGSALTTNPVGVHAFVWVGGWSHAQAEQAIRATRAAGYDFIELALLDPWSIDESHTRALLAENELGVTASLGLSPGTDINSEDPEAVAAGERLLLRAVDVVGAVGGSYLCGVIFSQLGRYGGPATGRGRSNSAAVLRRVADRAAEHGVTLGLEVVNRYETNLLNTAEQAQTFIDEIDRDNVSVHLDTYHMNIEEPDLVTPVLACGDRLGYVHVGESHRGYLGSGTVDFGGFFRALRHIDYRGPIAFESFSSTVVDETLSTNLCVWRDLWDDSTDLARHARQFIDGHVRSVNSISSQ